MWFAYVGGIAGSFGFKTIGGFEKNEPQIMFVGIHFNRPISNC